jgi:hypothetical protein
MADAIPQSELIILIWETLWYTDDGIRCGKDRSLRDKEMGESKHLRTELWIKCIRKADVQAGSYRGMVRSLLNTNIPITPSLQLKTKPNLEISRNCTCIILLSKIFFWKMLGVWNSVLSKASKIFFWIHLSIHRTDWVLLPPFKLWQFPLQTDVERYLCETQEQVCRL